MTQQTSCNKLQSTLAPSSCQAQATGTAQPSVPTQRLDTIMIVNPHHQQQQDTATAAPVQQPQHLLQLWPMPLQLLLTPQHHTMTMLIPFLQQAYRKTVLPQQQYQFPLKSVHQPCHTNAVRVMQQPWLRQQSISLQWKHKQAMTAQQQWSLQFLSLAQIQNQAVLAEHQVAAHLHSLCMTWLKVVTTQQEHPPQLWELSKALHSLCMTWLKVVTTQRQQQPQLWRLSKAEIMDLQWGRDVKGASQAASLCPLQPTGILSASGRCMTCSGKQRRQTW